MRKQRGDAELLIMCVLFCVVLGILFIVSVAWESWSCGNKADMMGLQSDWGVSTGCMVKVEKRWAPINYIRIVDDKIIIQGDGEE